MTSPKNIFYAQSGGPTAVINASACGVIETAQQYSQQIGKVFAGRYGILGAINEELIDTSKLDPKHISALAYTPGSAFGSCRYKLPAIEKDETPYKRLIEIFKAHNIGYFFYNGGGDSQDTAYKVSMLSNKLGYPLTCIGIPKTVDNDLAHTDNCPGFASAAKYISIATQEASLDIKGMAVSSTKIFILEVMGRHTGWLAAAGALGKKSSTDAPHIILLPEVSFDQNKFLQQVKQWVDKVGYCVIVASEGVRDQEGDFLSDSGEVDAFGHHQLGGVAPRLANIIKKQLGYKYHWAVADYLQRSARHIASQIDLDQAYALGQNAVTSALAGKNNIMLTIKRLSETPYKWSIESVPLQKVANIEKKLPSQYINADGFSISDAGLNYLRPLIKGEAYPPYKDGMPDYLNLDEIIENVLATKKLKPIDIY